MSLALPNGKDSGAAFSQEARALRSKEAAEVRETWQYKLLFETKGNGKEGEVIMVVLANLYLEALEVLLAMMKRRFVPPCLTGYARIMAGGQVVCDLMKTPSLRLKNVLLYDSEDQMIGEFRRLADKLKLPDAERIAMFAALKKWVSQDRRVGVEGDRKRI